ncbi:hypothetical protein KC338_g4338 [Hortaea werneckii]|nr:hypothetical protein KC323_g5189 [Hortaea werneckii]KAI6867619.1 hypothetical protein KC338_g4338 [Hortaea werneckii]KAI7352184.1 hypothetical protein KC320_g4603 [Hortaea werneckii]
MESLDKTEWDVIISGTGLPQSLLALSLSRSGLNILHVDRNGYYGGNEAAFVLSEAEDWAQKHSGDTQGTFSHAEVVRPSDDSSAKEQLGQSRAYSLALAPQLVYTRSSLLPALVSSRTHEQLEFQAVGSWFTVSIPSDDSGSQETTPSFARVPSGREDIFSDDTLDLRAKRSLTKFLRFVSTYDTEEQQEQWERINGKAAVQSLREDFGLKAEAAIAPLLALALTSSSPDAATMAEVVPKIARHIRSTGLFGPGFSAVLPKWGGLSEVAQVACRAGAVGGGVYVLGKGINGVAQKDDGASEVELSDGEKVSGKWLVGCSDDLPSSLRSQASSEASEKIARSISVISSPLANLFPATSEGGVTPAGAVVVATSGDAKEPPVHIIAHSSDSGECPQGQCILYAFTASSAGFRHLEAAIGSLLRTSGDETEPKVLWSLRFQQTSPVFSSEPADEYQQKVIELRPLPTDVALSECVLEDVKQAWSKIKGDTADEFMKFPPREGEEEEF